MEFICIVIPSGAQTHFLLICVSITPTHSSFLMDNDWKHSPVGISTALFETDVLETTDKLPVTVRNSHNHSGPSCAGFPTPSSTTICKTLGSVRSARYLLCSNVFSISPLTNTFPSRRPHRRPYLSQVILICYGITSGTSQVCLCNNPVQQISR